MDTNEKPLRKRATRKKKEEEIPVTEELQTTGLDAVESLDENQATTLAPATVEEVAPIQSEDVAEADSEYEEEDEGQVEQFEEEEETDAMAEDEDEYAEEVMLDEADEEAEYEDDYDEEETVASQLTHFDADGRAIMVDVTSKPVTSRTAVAVGFVRVSKKTLELLENQALPKGDALTVSEVAGIMASKRTPDLIPLCHPLALTSVAVSCEVTADGVSIRAEAVTQAQTGVEMEALTAVSVAALTLYDMCKGVDKNIIIGEVKLASKTGGVSGDWQAAPEEVAAAPVAPVDDVVEDDYDLEEEEEQIIPRSIPQPVAPQNRPTTYRRDSWSGGNQQRPYDRDQQRGGYQGNRPYNNNNYNRDNRSGPSSYGNRPAPGRPTTGGAPGYGNRPNNYNNNPARPTDRPADRGGYQGNKPYGSNYNRDQDRGGYNRDQDRGNTPNTPYRGRPNDTTRPAGTGYQGNRDRDARPNDRGGYPPNRPSTGGYQGNRERPSGPSGTGNRYGFGGFRDRNRPDETEER